jgi:hypothetical protein
MARCSVFISVPEEFGAGKPQTIVVAGMGFAYS